MHDSTICSMSDTSLDPSHATEYAVKIVRIRVKIYVPNLLTGDVCCDFNGPVFNCFCRERHVSDFLNKFTFVAKVREQVVWYFYEQVLYIFSVSEWLPTLYNLVSSYKNSNGSWIRLEPVLKSTSAQLFAAFPKVLFSKCLVLCLEMSFNINFFVIW